MKYQAKIFLLLFAFLSFSAMKCNNDAGPVDPDGGPATGIKVDSKNLALLQGECRAVDKTTFESNLIDANTRLVKFSWQAPPGVSSYSGTLLNGGNIVDNFQVTTPEWTTAGIATGNNYRMEIRSHCLGPVSLIVIEKVVVK
jgi:hypothetical protein